MKDRNQISGLQKINDINSDKYWGERLWIGLSRWAKFIVWKWVKEELPFGEIMTPTAHLRDSKVLKIIGKSMELNQTQGVSTGLFCSPSSRHMAWHKYMLDEWILKNERISHRSYCRFLLGKWLKENGASRRFAWHSRVGESEERATPGKCGITRRAKNHTSKSQRWHQGPEG